MQNTTHYNLKKPDKTDVIKIDDLNYNADVIDSELNRRVLKEDVISDYYNKNEVDGKLSTEVNRLDAQLSDIMQQQNDTKTFKTGFNQLENCTGGALTVEKIESGGTLVNQALNGENYSNWTLELGATEDELGLHFPASGSDKIASKRLDHLVDKEFTIIFFTEHVANVIAHTVDTQTNLFVKTISSSGVSKVKISANTWQSGTRLRLYSRNASVKVMILEGDWTNKDVPAYFEGIQGSIVRNIKTLSRNLANNNDLAWTESYRNAWNYSPRLFKTPIRLEGGKTYRITVDQEEHSTVTSAYEFLHLGIHTLDGIFINDSGISDNYNETDCLANSRCKKVKWSQDFTPSNDCLCNPRYHSTGSTQGIKINNIWIEEVVTNGEYETKYDSHLEHISKDGIELHCINGVPDELIGNTVIRRIKKVTLDGNGFVFSSNLTDDAKKIIHYNFTPYTGRETPCILTDENGIARSSYVDGYGALLHWSDSALYITIPNSVSGWSTGYTPTAQDIKILFSKKTHVLYYVAKEDYWVTEVLRDYNPVIPCHKDGYCQINYEGAPPEVSVLYAINIAAVRNAMANLGASNFKQINDLWLNLLPVADKELKMSGIDLLTTNTNDDIKNKMNEIINIWKEGVV